jgi:putative ABC transport system permease protein
LNGVDPGFQVPHVALTSISWQRPDGDATPRAALYRDLLGRFDTGSGTELALATVPPFRGVSLTITAPADRRDGAPPVEAHVNHVSANYFRVLGIPLLQGRSFSPAETGVEQPDVAVISDAMRRQYWSGGSPIGQRFRYGQNEIAEVVGVAADIRASHISSVDGPSFYLPLRPGDTPTILTRSADVHSTSVIIENAVRQRDASALVSARTLEEDLRDDLTPSRIGTAAALALAILSMALAAVGIYGVTAYVVTQRTREVGVRLALGAEPSAIQRLIIGQAMRPVVFGALVGLPMAAVVSVTATKLLLGVRPLDPVAFLAVSLFLAAVAFTASYVPARRATRVNPVVALRHT